MLLVTAICNPGVAPDTREAVSRFLPTVTLGSVSVCGWTLTVTLVPEAGVPKPAGAAAVSVVLPALALLPVGVNSVVTVSSPPWKTTGETAAPAPGLEFDKLTATVEPPRTCWISAKFDDASRRAAFTVNVDLAAPTLVVKLDGVPGVPFGPIRTKPEGVRVTVAWPVAKVSPLAEIVAVPLFAKPWR